MWRFRPFLPLAAGRAAGDARRGRHAAAAPARAPATRLGLPRSLAQGRGHQPHRLVQGARAERRGHPRGGGGRHALRHAHRRQRRRGPRRLRRRAGVQARVFAPAHHAAASSWRRSASSAASSSWSMATSATAARRPRPGRAAEGAYNVSTLREPYRIEGKKTLGLELAVQLGWTHARCDHLSHRRRHRADRHVEGVQRAERGGLGAGYAAAVLLGAVRRAAPRSCARSRPAPTAGEPWADPRTVAAGLRVPAPLGDRLMLRALRESGGGAVAVSDDELTDAARRGVEHGEGIDVSPEGGAAFAAVGHLRRKGDTRPGIAGCDLQHRCRMAISGLSLRSPVGRAIFGPLLCIG